MPESPADEPLKRTQSRVRLMRSIARGELECMAAPTDRGLRWFPAGKQIAASVDNWLIMEPVRALWTGSRLIFSAVVGRPYPMKLTEEGVRWLRAARPSGGVKNDASPDRRVS
jgi:hypothetical protein